jgi:multidrug efflux system outer membrane protein
MNLAKEMKLEWKAVWRWATGLALACLAGCLVGPNYERPAAVATMPAAFTGATNEWKMATPQAHLPKGSWWEIFGNAELNRLETQAAEANQELKAAVARFAQARAAADVARSGLFPRIGAGFTAVRQSDSANKPQSGTGQASGNRFTYDNFTLPFDLSYEVDLWGRVRRQVESARAKEQADAADLGAVKLAIAAEVAADFFTLRALDAEIVALCSTIEANRKSLELTPEQWEHLDKLAAALDATAPTGSNAGKPSWRTMIKEIANDTFDITRKDNSQ